MATATYAHPAAITAAAACCRLPHVLSCVCRRRRRRTTGVVDFRIAHAIQESSPAAPTSFDSPATSAAASTFVIAAFTTFATFPASFVRSRLAVTTAVVVAQTRRQAEVAEVARM